ncbi:MAG: tRNA guanosine(34) transglycosylase Tgt [Clostridium sp.]|nr:tRNA guanosine(34) transglycosylase Tgt [Acetatifactor muris]MCM1527132.1 tRNA guanosine(34) transglycosylase Tgt [Bacteroides sp.]MCM1563447.1 tRNA guanosine(34) transglycosylase Tgt [Clostridium sp.]
MQDTIQSNAENSPRDISAPGRFRARYRLLGTEGRAKRGEFITVHGVIQTPVFMNVGTVAAIKGAVSTEDLERIGTQVQLSNTYHLHVRPGDGIIRRMGGLHRFMSWDRPILTDSGGFQVFSLAGLRKIKEEGVYFHSHIDGRKIFMGPEESMQIQSNLGSTIAMAFDECAPAKAEREYVQRSVERTTRWLERCVHEMRRLNEAEGTVNPDQLLFGINQGAVYDDIRIEHAKRIRELDLDGYAIGGLAVGESHAEMYHVLEEVVPYLPQDRPTYLMGVGTPANILEAVERGVDFFDCVYPTRNGRHGHLYTNFGKINLFNAKYETDDRPVEEGCGCPTCQRYSRAYIRHLLKAKEMLGMRLCVLHNLYFYNTMMQEIRDALDAGNYAAYKRRKLEGMGIPES